MTKWMPEVGSVIAAFLPQEVVRATIKHYIDEDTVDVVLDAQPPMSKSHNYRFKQTVRLTRRKARPQGEKWASEDCEE